MAAHPYLPNSPANIKEKMLKELNISSISELYKDIPESVVYKGDLKLPRPHSEAEVIREVSNTIEDDYAAPLSRIFLGAGVWPHLIPSIIPALVNRSEFLTAYTP